MKSKLLSLALLLTLLPAVHIVRAQDTLHIGDRDPRYYYWGSNHWEYWYLNFTSKYNIDTWGGGIAFEFYTLSNDGAIEMARLIVLDQPLKIIGVAIPANNDRTGEGTSNYYYYDYPLPDYANLYSHQGDQMVEVASVRWDTASPRYYMPMDVYPRSRHHPVTYQWYFSWESYYVPVYEAYFENPVVMTDSFYVSVTNNGKYTIRVEEPIIDTVYDQFGNIVENIKNYQAHPARRYYYTRKSFSDDPGTISPIHNMRRYHYMDQDQRWIGPLHDTLWHILPYDLYSPGTDYSNMQGNFFNLFPIFDTSWSGYQIGDTSVCVSPSNFTTVNTAVGSATFYWESAAGNWELSYGKDIATPEEGTVVGTDHTFLQVEGLDTAQWYVAWVRSMCDSANVSEWSDSIRFYIPGVGGSQGDDSLMAVRTVENLFTNVMPNPATDMVTVQSSFRIKKVEFYTLAGVLARSKDCDGNIVNIDVRGLASGTYVLRITTNHGYAIKKLIIK